MKMKREEIIIALPKTIPLLKPCPHSSIGIGQKKEEYNFYFSNFIYPLLSDYEVQVHCEYGHNYGEFWRIFEFPDGVDKFPFTVVVYDGCGEELGRKECTIELYTDEQCMESFIVLPIGDSMTQSQFYLEHVYRKLPEIRFEGSRCFSSAIRHEGRGGFSSEDYVYKYQDPYAPSPFVFPQNVSGREYFGDQTFYTHMETDWESNYYVYGGYKVRKIEEGMIYNRDNVLYIRKGGEEQFYQNMPEWEFSFPKYMEKHQYSKVDAVSILLGTNDMMKLHYDTMKNGIQKTIENVESMIKSIREYSVDMPIILNMPILPTADSYAFGRNFACSKHPKEARTVMLHYLDAMLTKWQHSEDKNLHLVPLHAAIHPVLGFPKMAYGMGRYFDSLEIHNEDAIHPNKAGYSQMGDILAAMIQKIRVEKFRD